MAVDLLTVCEWHGAGKTDHEIPKPSWADVEQAIRALDGSARNDLYLQPDHSDPGTYLCVGGGSGRYILTGAIDIDREFPTLVDSGRPATPQEAIVLGGQEGLYPANWVVGLEGALSAARAFYDAGGFGENAPGVRV